MAVPCVMGVNTQIQQYNAYTKPCVLHPTNPNCGTTSNGVTVKAGTTRLGNAGGAGRHPRNVRSHAPGGDVVNPRFVGSGPVAHQHLTAIWPYDVFPGSDVVLRCLRFVQRAVRRVDGAQL